MVQLAVSGLSFAYGNEQVLQEVSFQAPAGSFVAILGPSGSGKSTLLNILAGLLPGAVGQVSLDGQPQSGISRQVAYMPQEDLLMPWRSVLDNVCLPLLLRGSSREAARNQATSYFAEFGLAGYEDKYPDQLSGGMRQRAAFLRTVLSDASVLLLDEPFGALDAITRQRLQTWLAGLRLKLNRTIVLVTHDIDEAIYLADRIYVLSSRPAQVALMVEINDPAAMRTWDWQLTMSAVKQQIHRALER